MFCLFSGREAHVSGPPSCLHDQRCHDAANGKTDLMSTWWNEVFSTLSGCFSGCESATQIGVTFAIVFGVILYRISTKAALHMSTNPVTRSHVQLTVKTTAAIINLVVILILDEVYGAVARWLTVLGKSARWDGFSEHHCAAVASYNGDKQTVREQYSIDV